MKTLIRTMKLVALAAVAFCAFGAWAAKMTADFTLQITPTDSGTATFNEGSWSSGETKTSNPAEGTVTVGATCKDGYEFVGWSVNPTDASFDYPTYENANLSGFTMGGSYTVTATFKKCVESVEYTAPVYVDNIASNGIDRWETKSCENYTVVSSSDEAVTWGEAGVTNWFVVTSTVEIIGGVTCKGHINLILCKGAKLTITMGPMSGSKAGIATDANGSFTVYGQPDGAGELEAMGGMNSAAIGGGDGGNGLNITINGGTVRVNSGDNSAGIGGGNCGKGSNITINGGKVSASGGYNSAGIGGGYECVGSYITINGGEVMATGGDNGAGIGGGSISSGSYITINGGEVTAKGGWNGAGIGGGNQAPGKNITINGGKVTATGGMMAVGIGPGNCGSGSSDIYASAYVVVKAGDSANPTTEIEHDASTDLAKIDDFNKLYVTAEGQLPPATVEYVAPVYVDNVASNGIAYWTTNKVAGYTVVTSAASQVTWGTAGVTNWFVVTNGTYQIDGGVICKGYVNLILCEGAKLFVTNSADAYAGIETDVNGSFTVYGQPDGAGELEAAGGEGSSGIGGSYHNNRNCSNITINGGEVTAKGGNQGAAIGGANVGASTNITINGGTVRAKGGNQGAAIGGGHWRDGFNIIINGGTVEATGGFSGAAIGGGDSKGRGLCIIINGGEVTANSVDGGAGIGGGYQGDGSNIAINGGKVTAKVVGGAAGIGGGYEGAGSYIAINDGFVMVANSGACDLIGNGAGCSTASGNIVSSSANVFFNLVGAKQSMPEDFDGFTIMTLAKQSADRVLVGGLADWTAATTFALTNSATAATTNIVVNGEDVIFARRSLSLTNETGRLTLRGAPVVEVDAPDLDNTTHKTYWGGEELDEPALVPTNATPVYVVYKAADGYYFDDVTTVKTNYFDTSTDPALVQGGVPKAPQLPIKYTAPVYVDNIASNGIAYWVTNTLYRYTVVTGEMGSWWEEEGWYVVTNDADVTRSGSVSCHGAINLVLCKGAKLTVTETGQGEAGIATDSDGSFTVYGQPDGAGTLVATGGFLHGAGIGGSGVGDGVNITINGGTVIANGGQSAAGIGGGNGTSGSNITINGGEVTATGGTKGSNPQAAGIGGGYDGNGENITINGGKVTATGKNGAGIGGGYNGSGSNITLNGGSVMAVGGVFSAGIGGGSGKAGSNIRIVGGKVAVFGFGDPIGSGVGGAAGSGNRISSVAQVFFNIAGTGVPMLADFEGFVIMTPEIQMVDRVLVGGVGAQGLSALPMFSLTNSATAATTNIVVNGEDVIFARRSLSLTNETGRLTLKGAPVVEVDAPDIDNTTHKTYWGDEELAEPALVPENATPVYVVYKAADGYYFDDATTMKTNFFDTSADPALIQGGVPKGPQLPIKYTAPVYVDNIASNGIAYWTTNKCYSYTVVTSAASQVTWGTAGVTNWFAVTNADVQITGGVTCKGYVNLILCEGAKLTVENADDAIATDANGSFTIYGQPDGEGELVASSGANRAGIGGGENGDGADITINGGKVTATGGSGGAGLGGGKSGVGSEITINGGMVTAMGGYRAAGIGGGDLGEGVGITINGGVVTAHSGNGAACIGGGATKRGYGIVIRAGALYLVEAEDSIVGIWNAYIGCGMYCIASPGVEILPAAKLFFSLDYGNMPPEVDFDGMVIMTRDTQTVNQVLIDGISPITTFALTNVVSGATTNAVIDGPEVTFAHTYCWLTNDNGRLMFMTRKPRLWIDQQPHVTNGYAIVAATDGNDGITNYIWSVKRGGLISAADTVVVLTNTAGAVANGTKVTMNGKTIGCSVMTPGNSFGLPGLPMGGKLRFTCPLELTTEADYGTLTRVAGTADEWVYEPVWNEIQLGEYYCTIALIADETLTIDVIGWESSSYTVVGEGADKTVLPVENSEPGTIYICQMIYGHEGIYYTSDSVEFKYLGTIGAMPTPVEHTTWAVYTNGFLSIEEDGVWAGWTNRNATVVYTADPGYFFADGSTVVTNTFDTSKNPAPADAPDAPEIPSFKYLAPVYKGTDGNPTNGIAYWVTNKVSVGSCIVVTNSTSAQTWGAAGVTNWFVVSGADVQIEGEVVCAGHVNLILCEGAKLTISEAAKSRAGIETDAAGSFTIYGQPDGAGELEVTGGYNSAGIGGGCDGNGSNITINGGSVTANGNWGAGIGGGFSGVGSNITINGGSVMAIGSEYAAGIGGGTTVGGLNITINGGQVSAMGGFDGAGIGGGACDDGKNITINGGEVTATGGKNGSGIGGGHSGSGSGIAINNGTVTVIAGDNAAAIGGGQDGKVEGLVINGGTIAILGNKLSDLIGSGKSGGESSDVIIAPTANILFSVCGETDPLPTDINGFVIMTPETPTNRVLVGGCTNWTAATTFALTNAVTGATGTIEVDGAGVLFAERLLELPCADGKLMLKATEYSMINPPTEVANTTAKVYTNDAEVAVGSGLPVTNGTPAYVVYTADDGFAFADGSTSKTNQLNTTVNPAVMLGDLPDAPEPLVVAEVIHNGVTTEFKTLEAAWEAAQQGTPANPAVIRLLKDIKLTNTLETVTAPQP